MKLNHDNAATMTAMERELLDGLGDQSARMLANVRQWSAINSGSRNVAGLMQMQRVVADHFANIRGANVESVALKPSVVIGADGEERGQDHPPAVRVVQRPDAPVQIAMTGHYDTVFSADSPFQTCTDLDDDTLNGPGVADMKGGLLVLAEALKTLESHPDANNVGYTVLISPDEEIGNPASAPFIAELGARAHVGMTYEPALEDGGLAGARKGSGNFSVVVRGRAAHAGREHAKGRNAIEAASRFVVGVQDLNGRRDGVTFNVGNITGGGPVNMVPDLAIAQFNIRVGEEGDMTWAGDEIDRLVAQIADLDGIAAKLHGGFTRPPKPMTPQNAQMFAWTKSAGAALGLDVTWKDTGGVCEGNNLWAAGCPNVDTLGVRGGRIHSSEEFVKLSSFAERARLSALMLFRFATGDFDARALRAGA